MKWVKRFGIVISALPITLAAVWVLYEIFGMCINLFVFIQKRGTHLEPETMLIVCPLSHFQQKCGKLK